MNMLSKGELFVIGGLHHKHKSIRSTERCFSGCVSADCDPRSHGNITVTEYCSCGATRQSNINQFFEEKGEWVFEYDRD